jgi:hypothetical protein
VALTAGVSASSRLAAWHVQQRVSATSGYRLRVQPHPAQTPVGVGSIAAPSRPPAAKLAMFEAEMAVDARRWVVDPHHDLANHRGALAEVRPGAVPRIAPPPVS